MGKENNNRCLQMKSILKQYGMTTAVNHVDFYLNKGEVVGLVGANGAGKSTLMSILTGTVQATDGTIEINGENIPSNKYETAYAMKLGIAAAYQELSLCLNLSVYENFGISHVNHKKLEKIGWRKSLIKFTKDILDECFPDNNIDVCEQVSKLSIEQQQMIEICRAVSTSNLNILVLDEPSSSLGTERINQLHKTVERLSKRGIGVIYITHKLEEIIKITSRTVLMNNGNIKWTGQTKEVQVEDLINMMGGKIKKEQIDRRKMADECEIVLSIKNFSTNKLHDINMTVGKGEIVGISGLGGAGQQTLLNEIFRASKQKKQNEIKIKGNAAYVSGDRRKEGIFPLWSIADNIIISSVDFLTRNGLLDKKKSDDLAQEWYKNLKFKAEGKDASIMSLSGGNQQKAIIGRGIASDADLIILDDPTRGVDVETKKDIYNILYEICKKGKSVLIYSTEDLEMEECDRVYVMSEGSIVEELIGNDVTVDNIIAASFKKVKDEKKNETTKATTKNIFHTGFDLIKNPSIIAILILAIVWGVMGAYNPTTLSAMGMKLLIGNAIPLVIVAMGQMFIILVGDINLGIGTAMGLVNVLSATFMVQNFVVGLLCYILFLAIYSATAALIHIRKMPSIVVSLGMLSIWLGVAIIIQETPGGSAPEWLLNFTNIQTPLLPIQVYICIILALLGYWIICKSKYGLVLRGIGNNPKAVEKHGWSYLVAHIVAYMISGCFVILAGLMLTGVSRGADANGATTYQMMSIATVLLGGCSFSGGYVEPVGVVAAGLAISLISSMLTFMGVNSNYQTAVIGVILLIALIGGGFLKRGGEKGERA